MFLKAKRRQIVFGGDGGIWTLIREKIPKNFYRFSQYCFFLWDLLTDKNSQSEVLIFEL